MFLFPDVAEEDFDFSAEWLVSQMDEASRIITFDGTGKNEDLTMSISYEENPEDYRTFSLGELVSFPRETFFDPGQNLDL